MRVLLIHPDDSPLTGPWSRQKWDLMFDLGQSSEFSAREWGKRCGCPILRSNSFRHDADDLRWIREILFSLRGRLLDREGIDWWELTCVETLPWLHSMLLARRMAAEIPFHAELWTTRAAWPVSTWKWLVSGPIRNFSNGETKRLSSHVAHYVRQLRRFSPPQIQQIFLDKYDSGYRWRSRFVNATERLREPSVLIPSAYENVSRMACAYARLLPEQPFFLVATRASAKKFTPQKNVRVRNLGPYAKGISTKAELADIMVRWEEMTAEFASSAPEFEILRQEGLLAPFPKWFRDCLRARDAWKNVFDKEPVSAVLCGDDSNVYTRLPVLLAAKRGIPTVDFHHGAMDGHYFLKRLPSDSYLAKSEMELDYLVRVCGLPEEKIFSGAPSRRPVGNRHVEGKSAIFFSEPYEIGGMRTAEVYREVLPPLCRLAASTGRNVIVKLHPFESKTERVRLVRTVLSREDNNLVRVVDGPISSQLMSQAWFGVTVESTVVLDCLSSGVVCFLCGWLSPSLYGYTNQYARFGVGEALCSAEEIASIPDRLAGLHGQTPKRGFGDSISAEELQLRLSATPAMEFAERRVS